MNSVSVRLYLRVRRSDGSRFFVQPTLAANGRLRPQFALVDGQPRHCPGAVYSLRYTAGGKRVWEEVGSDPQLALLAKERKERAMAARAAGVALAEDEPKAKIRLAEAIATYLEDTQLTKAPKTAEGYRETLRGVAKSMEAKYLEDLGRREAGRIRSRGQARLLPVRAWSVRRASPR